MIAVNMSKVCIIATSTSNSFQYYIPMFIYTAKTAYPTYYIKVFVHGELSESCRNLLHRMKSLKMCNSKWEVLENQFQELPKLRPASLSAMRFILPDSHYKNYDYVYITDIDFLIFNHKPTLKTHYVNMMDEAKQFYVAARSPLRRPRRRKISKSGWIRKFKRLQGGRVFFRVCEWIPKTKAFREKYYKIAIEDGNDSYDKHKFGSYREYDEVMLNRILRQSGIPTPRRSGKYLTNNGLDKTYRDIHLGDFKFDRRAHSVRKMARRMRYENAVNFNHLEKDPVWKEICGVCELESSHIRQVMRRCRKYCEGRKG